MDLSKEDGTAHRVDGDDAAGNDNDDDNGEDSDEDSDEDNGEDNDDDDSNNNDGDSNNVDKNDKNDSDENKVAAAAGARAMAGSVRGRMKKAVRDAKTVARQEVLRTPRALSLCCFVVTKLPAGAREESRALVVAVCASLRHRDASARDVARATLAKMAPHVAVDDVLNELRSPLPSGPEQK